MIDEFSALDEFCAGVRAGPVGPATELPGWSVKDNLSHLCGVEYSLLGRPKPDPTYDPTHVRKDLGALNEGDVNLRRS